MNSTIDVIELDVSETKSIDKFIDEFKSRFGTADVLLNNAGMAFKGDAFDRNVVDTTFQTNFYGTVDLSEKFLPYINKNGKIITVGSQAGTFNNTIKND